MLLNTGIIPAEHLGEPTGSSYIFFDQTTQAGVTYYYWLALVNSTSGETLFGPQQTEAQAGICLPLMLQ
jgi:hypothetical protein